MLGDICRGSHRGVGDGVSKGGRCLPTYLQPPLESVNLATKRAQTTGRTFPTLVYGLAPRRPNPDEANSRS